MDSFFGLFEPEGGTQSCTKSTWNHYHQNATLDSDDEEEVERDCLPPEPEQGNIEYKLKLINPCNQRFEHLVTQMKWRLREGHGEAIYQIGVEDSGKFAGLSKEDMETSLKTLRDMAARLRATTTVLRERLLTKSKKSRVKGDAEAEDAAKHSEDEKLVTEVLIRKLRKDDRVDQESVIDLRLAVMGGPDAGKSTLLGVLTQGELDNGRGRSRLNIFRHLHEIKSGRTSSISHEIVGFDGDGNLLNYAEMTTAEEICEHASKVVTFIDLAGHRKYLRTTILGLTGYSPHYVILVVAPPVNEIFQEHMAICLALRLPFFVVINKVDLGYYDPYETIAQLQSVARAQNCGKIFTLPCSSSHIDGSSLFSEVDRVPVFPVSCVTGEGLDELTRFIRDLSPMIPESPPNADPDSCLFQIDETFRVAGSPDPVLGGLLVRGAIGLGTRLLVGPNPDGEFSPVKIVSLHRNKAPCCFVRASQSASLTLAPPSKRDPPLPHLRPGMVLLSIRDQPHATLFFQASVIVVYHSTSIYPGFQATVHIGNVRQTCVIEGIMDIKPGGLQTNDTASVLFRFLNHPEYLRADMRLLLREGRTKVIGKITEIFPLINPQQSTQ